MTLYIVLNFLLLAWDARAFAAKPDSTYGFFKICYSTIIGVGIPFVMLMDYLVGYKFVIYDLDVIEYYFLAGYALLAAGAAVTRFVISASSRALAAGRSRAQISARRAARTAAMPVGRVRAGLIFLALTSLACTIGYLLTLGFSFGQSGYETRYEDATGSGLFLIFIPAFLPLGAYSLMNAKSIQSFAVISGVLVVYNVFIFLLLSGYRQLLIGTMLMIMIIAVKKQLLNRRAIILGAAVVLPAVALGLSFARYIGETNSPFANPFVAALYYMQGDIFPVDAPLKSYWYCSSTRCAGLSVFTNHLSKFVPRFLWPNKPEIALDAAGFYTFIIARYPRQLTLSATILGEGIIVESKLIFAFIMAISGSLAAAMTAYLDREDRGVLYYIVLANVYIGFFWVREGLEDAINRFVIMGVYLVIAVLVGRVMVPLQVRTRVTPGLRA